MSSDGVGPPCFVKSRVNKAIDQEILELFLFADKLCKDADFLFQGDFQQHLPTVPKLLITCLLAMVILCLIN